MTDSQNIVQDTIDKHRQGAVKTTAHNAVQTRLDRYKALLMELAQMGYTPSQFGKLIKASAIQQHAQGGFDKEAGWGSIFKAIGNAGTSLGSAAGSLAGGAAKLIGSGVSLAGTALMMMAGLGGIAGYMGGKYIGSHSQATRGDYQKELMKRRLDYVNREQERMENQMLLKRLEENRKDEQRERPTRSVQISTAFG